MTPGSMQESFLLSPRVSADESRDDAGLFRCGRVSAQGRRQPMGVWLDRVEPDPRGPLRAASRLARWGIEEVERALGRSTEHGAIAPHQDGPLEDARVPGERPHHLVARRAL